MPSKSLSSTKLTTPVTASAPYTDEAPPVSTSTRFTSADGMKFRSGEISHASPATMRRPLISTRVRSEPRLRRSTVAVPDAPLAMVEFCAEKTCGICRTTSSRRSTPV